MTASIAAFRALDSRTRFACLQHAVDASRALRQLRDRDDQREALFAVAGRVADEVAAMSREERVARLVEIDAMRHRPLLGPDDPGVA